MSRQWAIRLVLLAICGSLAEGHSMYQSSVLLDFSGHEIHAELQLPLERTQIALGKSIGAQSLDTVRTQLTAYILGGFHAHASSGPLFAVRLVRPVTLERIDGAPYIVAHLLLTATTQRDADKFEIEDDVLLDRIHSQVALVSIRSDWRTSVFADDPQLVGVLEGDSRSLIIDRSTGTWFSGFGSIFHLGMQHIAEGTDHLLFLLALLLPAPLMFSGSHWTGFVSVRESLLRILRIVTAFTVGHSITLALSALGLLHVASRPIEALIAVSIMVSALHALRPIFPGREAAIASFFGLIHGMAFATTLAALGLVRWELVASIFGFNLGIETMQLMVVIVTLPSLILLSRTPAYSILRIGGALFAAVASFGWIVERTLGKHTPVDFVVDGVAGHAVWLASGLFCSSLVLWMYYAQLSEKPHRVHESSAMSKL